MSLRPAPTSLPLPTTSQVYEAYAALMQLLDEHFAAQPGGRLLVVFSLSAAGIACAIAGCVAGLAVLLVEAEPEQTKQMLRLGLSDFVVSDLNEALQILKNQIRRAKPISVTLAARPELCAQQMVERGLQPEFIAGDGLQSAAPLLARGAILLEARLPEQFPVQFPEQLLGQLLEKLPEKLPGQERLCVVWRQRTDCTMSSDRLLAQVDALALKVLEESMADLSADARASVPVDVLADALVAAPVAAPVDVPVDAPVDAAVGLSLAGQAPKQQGSGVQREGLSGFDGRRQWLLRSPRYLGRRLGAEHCLHLRASELERLRALLEDNSELAAQVELVVKPLGEKYLHR